MIISPLFVFAVVYLGRQRETCCHPRCTLHRKLSAGMCLCGKHSLAENCEGRVNIILHTVCQKKNNNTAIIFLKNETLFKKWTIFCCYSSFVASSGNLLTVCGYDCTLHGKNWSLYICLVLSRNQAYSIHQKRKC